MRKGLVSLLAVAALLVSAQSASAQNFKFGPRVGYGTDFDFSIGGQATLGFNKVLFEGAGPLTGALAIDYFLDCPFDSEVFSNDYSCSFFEIAPTVFVPFNNGLFAGAGIDISRFSSDVDSGVFGNVGGSSTDIGLAIHGGYMFPLGGQTGMADARFALGGSEQLVLAFAFLFGGSN